MPQEATGIRLPGNEAAQDSARDLLQAWSGLTAGAQAPPAAAGFSTPSSSSTGKQRLLPTEQRVAGDAGGGSAVAGITASRADLNQASSLPSSVDNASSGASGSGADGSVAAAGLPGTSAGGGGGGIALPLGLSQPAASGAQPLGAAGGTTGSSTPGSGLAGGGVVWWEGSGGGSGGGGGGSGGRAVPVRVAEPATGETQGSNSGALDSQSADASDATTVRALPNPVELAGEAGSANSVILPAASFWGAEAEPQGGSGGGSGSSLSGMLPGLPDVSGGLAETMPAGVAAATQGTGRAAGEATGERAFRATDTAAVTGAGAAGSGGSSGAGVLADAQPTSGATGTAMAVRPAGAGGGSQDSSLPSGTEAAISLVEAAACPKTCRSGCGVTNMCGVCGGLRCQIGEHCSGGACQVIFQVCSAVQRLQGCHQCTRANRCGDCGGWAYCQQMGKICNGVSCVQKPGRLLRAAE